MTTRGDREPTLPTSYLSYMTPPAQEIFSAAVRDYADSLARESALVSSHSAPSGAELEVTATEVRRASAYLARSADTRQSSQRQTALTALASISSAIAGIIGGNLTSPARVVAFAISAMIAAMCLIAGTWLSSPTRRGPPDDREHTLRFILDLRELEQRALDLASKLAGRSVSETTLTEALDILHDYKLWRSEDVASFRRILQMRNSVVHGDRETLSSSALLSAHSDITDLQAKLRDSDLSVGD